MLSSSHDSLYGACIEEGALDMEHIQSGTGKGLLEFLEYAGSKGLLKPTTARAYRSAATKILAIDDHDIDIRELEINAHFERFERVSGHNYTPGSLNTYKARFSSAVDMYRDYLRDPSGFRPPVRQRRTATNVTVQRRETSRVPGSNSQSDQLENTSVSGNMLIYPFPLRSGQVAQLQLPHHLTSEDAQRMSEFLKSLAMDPPLQLPSGMDATAEYS
jgi:hypothetical protein